jgi:hypothetical protein
MSASTLILKICILLSLFPLLHSTLKNVLPEMLAARIRAINPTYEQWSVLGKVGGELLAVHHFTARELPLEKRYGEVEVLADCGMVEHIPGRQITLGIDAAHERVEVCYLLLGNEPTLPATSSAHLLGLLVGLEPCIDLTRPRAVGADRHPIAVDVDVPLKNACALRIGDQHRGIPTFAFMGRKADRGPGVSIAQIIDLVQFEFMILGGIERHAVVERNRDIAVSEERHDIVNVLEGRTSGREGDGLAGFRDFLNEKPVIDVGTRKLDQVKVEFLAEVYGGLIEGGRGGEQTAIADGGDQGRILAVIQTGVQGLLDVADVGTLAVVSMDKRIHVSELQLDGRANIIEADDLRELRDNAQAPVDVAPVVIGHFKDEQLVEYFVGIVWDGHIGGLVRIGIQAV